MLSFLPFLSLQPLYLQPSPPLIYFSTDKAHVFRFGIYPIAKSATNLEVVWKEAEKAGHCREEDRDLEARWYVPHYHTTSNCIRTNA